MPPAFFKSFSLRRSSGGLLRDGLRTWVHFFYGWHPAPPSKAHLRQYNSSIDLIYAQAQHHYKDVKGDTMPETVIIHDLGASTMSDSRPCAKVLTAIVSSPKLPFHYVNMHPYVREHLSCTKCQQIVKLPAACKGGHISHYYCRECIVELIDLNKSCHACQ